MTAAMREPLLLLLLAFHSIWAMDAGLMRMCLSPHIDSPSETNGTESRIQGDSCVQTFPYVGTQEQHETFCRSKMPYEFTLVSSTDKSVTCKWDVLSTRCDLSDKKRVYQINGKCFTVKSDCSKEGLSRAKPGTVDHLRWLSIFYRNTEIALRVEATKVFKIRNEFRYDRGNVFKVSKSDNYKKVALMIQRLTPFDQFPGDYLPSDSSMLAELCFSKTKISGAAASPMFSVPPGSGDGAKARQMFGSGSSYTTFPLKDGDEQVGFAAITRNDYIPQFADDGLVDLDHFHQQCEKFCTDCYAASQEVFEKYRATMPLGRFYAPGGRRDQKKDAYCGAAFNMEDRKRFQIKSNMNAKSKAYIPTGRHWWNGEKDTQELPSVSCSDQSRTAVQVINSENDLTYVDVPSFDRHPIVCISGPAVANINKDGDCFPNSKMQNGKCVCKDGYDDALDITEFRDRMYDLGLTKAGHICVKPQSCKDEKKSSAIGVIFLVDSSRNIIHGDYHKQVLPFVESFADKLPNKVPVLFFQYSRFTWYRKLDPGWTKKMYSKLMHEALDERQSGGSPTYYFMDRAMDLAEDKWKTGRKLLIVITDIDAEDLDPDVVARREKLGYDTVYIAIGDQLPVLKEYEKNNKHVTFYEVGTYMGLGSDLMSEITERICKPWPEGHFLKAIYGDDWKNAT